MFTQIQYQDLVLALVHIHVPGCQPSKLKSRRSEVLAVVERRVAAARIIAFLRRREEWRKTWGNPLALIREEIKKVNIQPCPLNPFNIEQVGLSTRKTADKGFARGVVKPNANILC